MGEVLGFHWGAYRPPSYRTAAGPISGPFKHRGSPQTIDATGPDDEDSVGTATLIGSDGAGVALWRIAVGGAEVPGTWIVTSGEFRPAW